MNNLKNELVTKVYEKLITNKVLNSTVSLPPISNEFKVAVIKSPIRLTVLNKQPLLLLTTSKFFEGINIKYRPIDDGDYRTIILSKQSISVLKQILLIML